MTHDYTHKGGVVHTEILLPDHAPAQAKPVVLTWHFNSLINWNLQRQS